MRIASPELKDIHDDFNYKFLNNHHIVLRWCFSFVRSSGWDSELFELEEAGNKLRHYGPRLVLQLGKSL